MAVNGSPVERPADVIALEHAQRRRHPALLHDRPSRRAAGTRRHAGAVAARQPDVLRAGGRRPLHAARRRVRAAAPSRRSGDAAFLLAVRRVLRRVHVLVQRSVRSARLDLLLGRRGRDGAAAAAAARFHGRVSRTPAAIAVRLVAVRAARVRAGAGARRRARDCRHAGRADGQTFSRAIDPLDRADHIYLFLVRDGGARRAGARVRADHVRDRASASCAGSPGARPSASAPSRCSTRCRGRSAWIRR